MAALLAILLALTSVYVLSTGIFCLRVSESNRISLVYYFLFLLLVIFINVIEQFLSLNLQIIRVVLIACCFLRFSKHFIISPDMKSLFNKLLRIIFHTLKISEPYPVN